MGANQETVLLDGVTPLAVRRTVSDKAAGGTISGRVTDEKGSPIVGVTVYAMDSTYSIVSAVTDVSGNYTLVSLGAGTWYPWAGSFGDYVGECYGGRVCSGVSSTSWTTPVTVTEGVITPNIDFSLGVGGHISGLVTNETTGTSAPSADVWLRDMSGNRVAWGWVEEAGDYETWPIPAGSYYAHTEGSGLIDELYDNVLCVGGCATTGGTTIPVAPAATTPNIDFALATGHSISGRITDSATGLGVAYAWVSLYSGSGSWVGLSNITDATGNYSLPGLAAGTYFAKTSNSVNYVNELYDDMPCVYTCPVTTGTPIDLTSGDATSIDFALTPGRSISGRITDATTGNGISEAYVAIYDAAGSWVAWSSRTGATGSYSASGLPEGTYFARTDYAGSYVNELYDNIPCVGSCSMTTGAPIVATASNATGIDFALALGATISGGVTDGATSTGIAGVVVVIYDASGSRVLSSGATSSAGAYAVSGLLAGSYFARTFNSVGYVNELYDNMPCVGSCSVTTGTPIAVTATGTTTANFALALGATIRGSITDGATGTGIAGVDVIVYDASGAGVLRSATTGSTGAYVVSGLLAGSYFARTFNSLGYVNELYDDKTCAGSCTVTIGTPIALAVGGIATANFSLILGRTISGVVTDAVTGAGIEGASVSISNGSGLYLDSPQTTASGAYVVTGIPPGVYYATSSNTAGYLNERYDDVPCATGCNQASGVPVDVTATNATGINFSLVLGGKLAGQLTDEATGAPLTYRGLWVWDSLGHFAQFCFADGTGMYSTDNGGLPPGSYFVQTSVGSGYIDELYDDIPYFDSSWGDPSVTSGVPMTVVVGATVGGVDFALARGGTISGTVRDAVTGAGISGVNVYVHDGSGKRLSSGRSNSAGSYSTSLGLPSGTFYVTAQSPNHLRKLYAGKPCDPSCDVTRGTGVAVTAGSDTPAIDFVLSMGAAIRGRVTDSATTLPIASYTLRLYDALGTHVASTSTSETGDFVFAGLYAGTYHARTWGTGSSQSLGFIDQVFSNTVCLECDPTMGTPILVTTGTDALSIDFALTKGGTVSGRVTDAVSGVGLPYYTDVELYSGSTGQKVATAFADSAGSYTLAVGLPTGTYFARSRNPHGYVDEIWNNLPCGIACDPSTGTAIAVTLGADTSGVDFALDKGGSIQGVVTDAVTGEAMPGVDVVVHDSLGNPVNSYVPSDANGAYEVSGLPTGSYTARTRVEGGYLDEVFDEQACDRGVCDMTSGDPIAVTAGSATAGVDFALVPGRYFHVVEPCRIIDTRDASKGGPALVAGVERVFVGANRCGVPITARALSVNVTVTAPTNPGNLRLYPAGIDRPQVSTVNYSAGQTRANNAILRLASTGDFALYCQGAGTAHVILDVNGYFE